jgi:hypothetical protein
MTTSDQNSPVRRQTALAFGIAEWANAMDHLNALRQVGERCPRWIVKRIEHELDTCVQFWPGAKDIPVKQRTDRVVDEVGQWLVDHQDVLNDVLGREPEPSPWAEAMVPFEG